MDMNVMSEIVNNQRVVRTDDLSRHPESQIRGETDARLVAEYAEAMLEGAIFPPVVIYQVDPEFSDQARMAKYQGVAVVEFIVDTKGLPQDIRVVRALGMGLDQKAVEAVRQFRFKPAMLKGRPVPVLIDMSVDFHIY